MKTPHELLMNLAKAREEHIAAKKAMYDLPLCKLLPPPTNEERYETCIGLYGHTLWGMNQWCPSCVKRNSAWHRKQSAASKAGAALRACLRYAKEGQ